MSNSELTNQGVRLNKFISDTGHCSRREADKLIEQGRVTINGQLPEMGMKVQLNDEVCVDDRPLKGKEAPIYLVLNKPTGITCTTERHIEGNIIDFIGHRKRIFPIGRLDKFSDGLIFLTNDGDIVNKVLRAGNAHEKEYVVRVNNKITDDFIQKMASGVNILDTVTLPCKVTKESEYAFRIVLTQGLNRQIRRMCEALGYEVYKLRRVRIMNISLDGLGNGKWRYMTDAEIAELNQMIAGSSGTEEASREVKGKSVRKATDAKLYDHRQQQRRNDEFSDRRDNTRSDRRGNPSEIKTFRGKGARPDDRRDSGKSNDKRRSQYEERPRRSDRQDAPRSDRPQARNPRPTTRDDDNSGIIKWQSKKNPS